MLLISYFYYSLEEKSCISKSFLEQVYFMQGNNVLFLFGVWFFFFEGMKVYEKHRVRVSVLETHGLFQLIPHDSCTCFSYSIPLWGVVRNRFVQFCFWTFLVWNIFNLSELFVFFRNCNVFGGEWAWLITFEIEIYSGN